MTREELEKTHPDYSAYISEWQFFIRSYMGGKFYREGNYLLKHPFESSVNYDRRLKTAYYYNYCAPVVDVMVSHLFRRPPLRDFGSLSKDPVFEAFLPDCDLEGSSFSQFMRDAQRFSSIYGRVTVVVDKPAFRVSTKAEAGSLGIRPYLSLVTPENLIDWEYRRLQNGRPELKMVRIKEGADTYRIWTTEGWEFWQAGKKNDKAILLDSGEHGLGVVPAVNIYNKKSGVRMLGASDIQDIADVNKNIYYLCSDAKEIIENTAFPMLALPYEKGGAEKERETGPRNILQFDPELPNARPFWLEAPHSSLTEIREWVKQDIQEIHRIAKLGGVRATEDAASPRSGVALELESQQLHAALAEKADNVEQAERRILDIWAGWEGKEFDGVIDYPDDFSVKDLDRDLDRALKALGVNIESRTFRKELQKSIVSTSLPKAEGEIKKEIMAEIDASA